MHHSTFALENPLDLGQLVTTGSVLHINNDYNENEEYSNEQETKSVDIFRHAVKTFNEFDKALITIDEHGFVKKKVIEEGGGAPLDEGFTVSIAFSGYWANEPEPFDVTTSNKPLVVDLKDNGLLPGLQIAVKSMLVGEMSAFLLSYKVMYGELGVPPRIKPKTNCIFYIKLLKSVITTKQGKSSFSQHSMFAEIHHEVKLLYSSGIALHQANNIPGAIRLFKKAERMLHNCHLVDEKEEAVQEKLLVKLYTNLSVCYNKTKQPLKTCIACNELQRIQNLHNNAKALFQNAKALRMIGEFDQAAKKLRRVRKLNPNSKDIDDELELLEKTRNACNQTKLIMNKTAKPFMSIIDDNFKLEVDSLIKNFKENPNLCKLTLPAGLNSTELNYVKEACIRENLFFNKIKKGCVQDSGENFALDKNEDKISSENDDDSQPDTEAGNPSEVPLEDAIVPTRVGSYSGLQT